MIDVQNLTFQYPRSLKPVLSGFNARFERGEIVAVSGKNGCGKTTLTKLLVGILQPSEGVIRIDEQDTSGLNLFAIGRRVGYVFQNPGRQLFNDTVFNEASYGLSNMDMEPDELKDRTERCLNYFGLLGYRDIYPGKLSYGERQRLAIASVIVLGTNYLVLDEPTTGLDKRRQGDLGVLLQRLSGEMNCGIVFVSHDDGFIRRFASREVVMEL